MTEVFIMRPLILLRLSWFGNPGPHTQGQALFATSLACDLKESLVTSLPTQHFRITLTCLMKKPPRTLQIQPFPTVHFPCWTNLLIKLLLLIVTLILFLYFINSGLLFKHAKSLKNLHQFFDSVIAVALTEVKAPIQCIFSAVQSGRPPHGKGTLTLHCSCNCTPNCAQLQLCRLTQLQSCKKFE